MSKTLELSDIPWHVYQAIQEEAHTLEFEFTHEGISWRCYVELTCEIDVSTFDPCDRQNPPEDTFRVSNVNCHEIYVSEVGEEDADTDERMTKIVKDIIEAIDMSI